MPSKRGSAEARQYDGASACTVNSSVSAWLTRRWRMSTSGLMISVTPPRSLWVSNHGSASAPGRCGAIAQAPASTSAVAPMSGTTSRANGWRSVTEDGARRARRPQAQHGESDEAGTDDEQAARHTVLVHAEGGDEHEEHGAGHERLATRLGPERERVRQPDHRAHGRARHERPASGVGDRGGRSLEIVLDDAEVGAHHVPRVGQRERAAERLPGSRSMPPPT